MGVLNDLRKNLEDTVHCTYSENKHCMIIATDEAGTSCDLAVLANELLLISDIGAMHSFPAYFPAKKIVFANYKPGELIRIGTMEDGTTFIYYSGKKELMKKTLSLFNENRKSEFGERKFLELKDVFNELVKENPKSKEFYVQVIIDGGTEHLLENALKKIIRDYKSRKLGQFAHTFN